ncbi:ATP-dependent helicase [Mucilaginibacter pallidiroseus]|uniref:DNA 3'-5' helicase II n=1 Tax=Mucilaginibacter pallidiroseus TaxID=2599295 RepID=A0A563UHR2_9SPHI|nr:UvrD-helicase domain-containing protein [Mucilaginibacter pallidiroseus]TWR30905.1 ATP-dependent helicase [Mucilaginibacter pallidiroseus]
MMSANTTTDIESADDIIFNSIQPQALKSFFLFAGAGSGKTRSLVNALKRFREAFGIDYRLQHRRIAVITYTKAASNVVKERMEFDPLVFVSTIHSFCWELIQHFQHDIRKWRIAELQVEIDTLEAQIVNGRAGRTLEDRKIKLEKAKQRLEQLPNIKKIVYNPNGDNRTRDSLSHSHVIKIATDFIRDQPLMQQILINKFPIIIIDEAQDTRKELIEVLFALQSKYKESFALGLFGDTMQRIYLDGKENLGNTLPEDWLKPEKTTNYRCPVRIITLINQIRSKVDTHQQCPAENATTGFARLFIVDNANKDKTKAEAEISSMMKDLAGDEGWQDDKLIKKLILEHHMAASRLGFKELYEALNGPESYRTGLLDGTLPSIQVFTKLVAPLVLAHQHNDAYEVMRLLKKHSPLMDRTAMMASENQIDSIGIVHDKVKNLLSLWQEGSEPSVKQVAEVLKAEGLFLIPDVINVILSRKESGEDEDASGTETNTGDDEITAWETALQRPFAEIIHYKLYVEESSGFGTHQGVKGLEFPRVMVILDDENARGNLFKYERLFGVEELSDRDLANQKEGKETSLDRTRRLLYVACSRAEQSLAIVAYTSRPEVLSKNAIDFKWFESSEIHLIN